jgi:glycosyltransferase involved in cell wall biosynthesis
MARAGTAPGWPLPAILTGSARPLLTCAITTYNRAPWLTHSLPRLIEAARPFRDQVEVVVCDNTSTDATPDVVARFIGMPGFSSCRNPANLGMLSNFGATTRASNGAYVWLLGDDDLIIDGAIEAVLSGLEAHPWIPERSATRLREADLNVLSKLGNQGLEWRLEPEAFTGREVGREDDLLDVLVGCPVDIQVARQPST